MDTPQNLSRPPVWLRGSRSSARYIELSRYERDEAWMTCLSSVGGIIAKFSELGCHRGIATI